MTNNFTPQPDSPTLLLLLIGGIFAATVTTLIMMDVLNEASLFGFPLGYFILVNGILLLAVMSVFWAAHMFETIDHEQRLTEEE